MKIIGGLNLSYLKYLFRRPSKALPLRLASRRITTSLQKVSVVLSPMLICSETAYIPGIDTTISPPWSTAFCRATKFDKHRCSVKNRIRLRLLSLCPSVRRFFIYLRILSDVKVILRTFSSKVGAEIYCVRPGASSLWWAK